MSEWLRTREQKPEHRQKVWAVFVVRHESGSVHVLRSCYDAIDGRFSNNFYISDELLYVPYWMPADDPIAPDDSIVEAYRIPSQEAVVRAMVGDGGG